MKNQEFHISIRMTIIYYEIVFTNNNWLTEDYILVAKDNCFWEDKIMVSLDKFLGDKEEAIELATKLKSYEDCLFFNLVQKNRYHDLIDYRAKNPVIGNGKYSDLMEKKKVESLINIY